MTQPSGGDAVAAAIAHRRLVFRSSDQAWLEFWEIVATTMPGLHDLRVRFRFLSPIYGSLDNTDRMFARDRWLLRDVDAPWVRPLLRIRGLKTFELEILDLDPRNGYDRVSAAHRQDDLEPVKEVKLLVEDVRHAVCQPSPTGGDKRPGAVFSKWPFGRCCEANTLASSS